MELFNGQQIKSALSNKMKIQKGASDLLLDSNVKQADFAIPGRQVKWPPLTSVNQTTPDAQQRITKVVLHHVLIYQHLMHMWSTGHHEEMRKDMDGASWIPPNRLYRPFAHTNLPEKMFEVKRLESVALRKAGKYCEKQTVARVAAEDVRKEAWEAQDLLRGRHVDFDGRVQRMGREVDQLQSQMTGLVQFMEPFAMNQGESNVLAARGAAAAGEPTDAKGRTLHAFIIYKIQTYLRTMHSDSKTWATPCGTHGGRQLCPRVLP